MTSDNRMEERRPELLANNYSPIPLAGRRGILISPLIQIRESWPWPRSRAVDKLNEKYAQSTLLAHCYREPIRSGEWSAMVRMFALSRAGESITIRRLAADSTVGDKG
ncbi:unnamed protein product [Nezara viridula]|uniref:Uncharacterized protein n=1 Tax=Nezara viridula TaxID=85310 RepID=A0A9P0HRP5_NEZVI|nr:unnamed protein product [Nezara viridula]